MIRVAVVGLGTMGCNHVRLYGSLEDARLAAVCDVDLGLAQRVAHPYGLKAYSDYRQLLDESEVEALSIAVPTRLHREVAMEAISRGIHILVEKPIAATVAEAQEMVQRAREQGVVLAVGHVERFNPVVAKMRELLERRELGRVFQIQARRVGPFPARVRDVGVVLDLATHDLDLMRWLMADEVVRVYCETSQRIHTEHEDLLCGLLRFRGGAVGILEVNWLTPTKVRELCILGEGGMFSANYMTQELFFYRNGRVHGSWESLAMIDGVSEGGMCRVALSRQEPLQLELKDFLYAVSSGGVPFVDGAAAVAALSLAEQFVESGRTGRMIEL